MNLKQRLSLLKKSDSNAIPLEEAVPEPMTTEELQSRRGAIVRQHLRLQGKSDEEIDTSNETVKGGSPWKLRLIKQGVSLE